MMLDIFYFEVVERDRVKGREMHNIFIISH